jgi:hypothetical protein
MSPNLRVNRTTRPLRWRVPSSLRSSAAGYAARYAYEHPAEQAGLKK